VVTSASACWRLDCKMTFDDNALDRHPEVAALRDLDEEDPSETEARGHDLSFIKLDGSMGAWSRRRAWPWPPWNIIKHFGAAPANFLDVGGRGDAKKRVDEQRSRS